jgi:hypothetical protein
MPFGNAPAGIGENAYRGDNAAAEEQTDEDRNDTRRQESQEQGLVKAGLKTGEQGGHHARSWPIACHHALPIARPLPHMGIEGYRDGKAGGKSQDNGSYQDDSKVGKEKFNAQMTAEEIDHSVSSSKR